MSKVDMHLASFISATKYDLQDTWSTIKAYPDNDVFLGGKNDLNVISYGVTNGRNTLVYTRLLNTGDAYDATITKGQSVLLNIVFGRENYPVYHSSRIYKTAMQIDATTNSVTIFPSIVNGNNIKTPVLDNRTSIEAHGILLIISWGLSFLGIIAARFMKNKSYGIVIHIIAMSFPTLITLVLIYGILINSFQEQRNLNIRWFNKVKIILKKALT